MSESIYSHFHPDERHFIDRAVEWMELADLRHRSTLTDFLDPRQVYILQSIVNREQNIRLVCFGGSPSAERKRAIIAREYTHIEEADFRLGALQLTSDDQKLEAVSHGDVLGAVLGIGIKRDKLGDIYLNNRSIHLVLAAEMLDYVRLHLQQVHRVHVYAEAISLQQLSAAPVAMEELRLSVASLRLDGILSDVIKMSRAKVLQPIKAGRCKVNWKVEQDPSFPLKQGDVVSLQGFGRFQVLELQGQSKSGRHLLKVGKYI